MRHKAVLGVERANETKGNVMNNIRKNGVTAALDFAILALPASAYAELKPSAALQSACRADAFKLCSTSLFSINSVVACRGRKSLKPASGAKRNTTASK
jgi:hypothetical protein